MKFSDCNPSSDLCFGNYDRGIPITDPSGKPFQIQIPRVYAPFGLSGFPNKFGPVKYNIDASMRGWNEDGSYMNKFFNCLQDIETVVIDHVRALGVAGPHPEQSFNSNVKRSDRYDPKFRIKVDNKTAFFDKANNVITPDELAEGIFKGYSFTALVELKNVYFFNRQMGLTWTMVQAKMYEPALRRDIEPPSFEDDETVKPSEKLGGFKFLV